MCVIPLSNECSDGFANPFRMDFSRVQSNEYLLHAIMAITSQHIAKRDASDLMTAKMHEHWSTSMQLFSDALPTSSALPLLDTIMVLITYQVCKPSTTKSTANVHRVDIAVSCWSVEYAYPRRNEAASAGRAGRKGVSESTASCADRYAHLVDQLMARW